MRVTKQQVLLFIAFCCLAAGIILISMIRSAQLQVSRKMGILEPSPQITDIEKKLSAVPVHSSYLLPYPGLLPTHYLYPLKMVRDRVVLVTTLSPDKKAERLLLYANKRMESARLLLEIGTIDEAVSVATKATDYLQQAIDSVPFVSQENHDAYVLTLKQSMLKHEEIIEQIAAVSENGPKNQAQILYKRVEVDRQRLTDLTGQPFGFVRPEEMDTRQ